MINHALITREYPFLDTDIYLNLGSEGLPPLSTQVAFSHYMESSYRCQGTKSSNVYGNSMEKVRSQFAELIHAKPQEIAMVKNTTEGISIIAQGYPFLPTDNIVISAQEHPSCLFSWINLVEQGRISLNLIPELTPEFTIADIFNHVDENTRAIVISAVQYSTGFFADLKEIGTRCVEQNILFIVDGIQALGRLHLDVNELHIDYLSCGGHKGLLGVHGLGFVYCRESLVPLITPPYASKQGTHMKGTALPDNFSKIDWLNTASRFESGVSNHIALCAFEKSLAFLLTLGASEIQEHILSLEEVLRKDLLPLGDNVISYSHKKHQSGIICIKLPLAPESNVTAYLNQHHIFATVRNGYLRLVIGLYNTTEQMHTTAQTVLDLFS